MTEDTLQTFIVIVHRLTDRKVQASLDGYAPTWFRLDKIELTPGVTLLGVKYHGISMSSQLAAEKGWI